MEESGTFLIIREYWIQYDCFLGLATFSSSAKRVLRLSHRTSLDNTLKAFCNVFGTQNQQNILTMDHKFFSPSNQLTNNLSGFTSFTKQKIFFLHFLSCQLFPRKLFICHAFKTSPHHPTLSPQGTWKGWCCLRSYLSSFTLS